jgi:L-malate glycosyltransferase
MTILLITPLFPESLDTSRAHMTFALYDFVKHWKAVHRIVVVIPRKNSWRRLLSARDTHHHIGGIAVLGVPYFRISHLDLVLVNTMGRRIVAALRREGVVPDIVISHYHVSIRFGAAVSRILRCPFVAGIHKRDIENLEKGEARRYVGSYQRANLIAFRSKPIEERFKTFFPSCSSPAVIANSGVAADEIEAESFCRAKARKIAVAESLHLITVARLVPLKCIDVTLRALANIRVRAWHYDILGDGAEMPGLQRLARDLGIQDRVTFHGDRPHRDVLVALRSAEIFVMASHHETFGIAYLEAMAKGCVVVGARGWGIDGIVKHGRNGFLCEPGNVADLEGVLQRIAGMKEEPLERIAAEAHATISEFTEAKAAARYLEAVEGALDESRIGYRKDSKID